MNGRDAWNVVYDALDDWNAAHEADIDECLYCDGAAILGTGLCEEHLHEYTMVERIEQALGVRHV